MSQNRAVREKKKEKKEIRSLSDDDDDVLLLAGDLSHASETPTFGSAKEDFGGRKRDVDRSLFSFDLFPTRRDLFEKSAHI